MCNTRRSPLGITSHQAGDASGLRHTEEVVSKRSDAAPGEGEKGRTPGYLSRLILDVSQQTLTYGMRRAMAEQMLASANAFKCHLFGKS